MVWFHLPPPPCMRSLVRPRVTKLKYFVPHMHKFFGISPHWKKTPCKPSKKPFSVEQYFTWILFFYSKTKIQNRKIRNLPMLFWIIPICIIQWNESGITSFLIKTVWIQLKDDSPIAPFSIPFPRNFKSRRKLLQHLNNYEAAYILTDYQQNSPTLAIICLLYSPWSRS